MATLPTKCVHVTLNVVKSGGSAFAAGHARGCGLESSAMIASRRVLNAGRDLRIGRRRAGPMIVRGVLTESQTLEMGTRAPDFSLPEPLTGKTWTLSDFEGHPALLVVFICNHCPFVIHVRDQLVALAKEYMDKHGVAVVAISSNSTMTHPQDGPELMAKEAEQFAYPFPYLFDATQDVAKAYKAACTPDFFIFRKDGRRPFELAYHGQLDDSRPSNGRLVTGKDIRKALDCIVSARPVPSPQKPSIGCNIKWNPGSEPDYFGS